MRKLKIAAKTFGLVLALMTPSAAAMFQLGAGLSSVERMKHARMASAPSGHLESVGLYEGDPTTGSDGLRFRSVMVHGD